MNVRPIFHYPGSKWNLAPHIIALMPEHHKYIEAFGGSGSVLLRKPLSAIEVYNDVNEHLVTLFQVIRDASLRARLIELLNWTPYARREWQNAGEAILTRWDELDIVERARLVFVRYTQGFCGRADEVGPATWRPPTTRNYALQYRQRIKNIEAIGRRLTNVHLECMDYAELFKLYDDEGTLWYLDPPYVTDTRRDSVDALYRDEMRSNEHFALVMRLLELRGYAILSGYETPLYKPLMAAGWDRIAITVRGGMGRNTRRVPIKIEQLWTNIPPELRGTFTNSRQLSLLYEALDNDDV